MARKRMIDPNIWQSEDFSHLSVLARLVFIGLFSNADDEGRGRAKPNYIKSTLFPYDADMRVTDIERALSEISSHMSVAFYSHNQKEYYCLTHWDKWQRVDRPQKSLIPAFGEGSELIRGTPGEDSAKTCRTPGEDPADARGTIAPNRSKENKSKENEDKNNAGAYEEALVAFLEHRRAKGKPMTEYAKERLREKLSRMAGDDDTKAAILNQSILKGWTDVYPLEKAAGLPAGDAAHTRDPLEVELEN